MLHLGIPELTLQNDPKNLKNESQGDGTSKNIFLTHHYFSLKNQGWPEKDQSGFDRPVLTGLNHLKKPNFDHLKRSKLKNQDFSEVNINKRCTKKEININVLC